MYIRIKRQIDNIHQTDDRKTDELVAPVLNYEY